MRLIRWTDDSCDDSLFSQYLQSPSPLCSSTGLPRLQRRGGHRHGRFRLFLTSLLKKCPPQQELEQEVPHWVEKSQANWGGVEQA
jgi:hypothetical protein